MKSILITSYANPDLDGVASAIAYGEFLLKTGKNNVVGIINKPHDEAKYVLDQFHLKYPQLIKNSKKFDQIILVDVSDINGLKGKISSKKVIEIIDHREKHKTNDFPKAKIQLELVGAAATLIAEKFIKNKIKISKESAVLIYSAIISNTLNFKSTNTTKRDKKAAIFVNKIAKLPRNFWKILFTAKSDLSDRQLTNRIKDDLKTFNIGNKKIGIAQIEILGAKKLINKRGLEILKTLKKIKTKMKLDLIFQNTIELQNLKTFLVTDDAKTKKILEKILAVKFSGILAEKSKLILRKQIVPLLKKELKNNH